MVSRDIGRRFAKVVVTFKRRDDGGLRAWSDDVPGFVLSHRDPQAVIRDVGPALERILSAMWGAEVKADLLARIDGKSEVALELPSTAAIAGCAREYAAHVS